MKTLQIAHKSGTVTISKTRKGLVFDIPTGMNGNGLLKFKDKHAEAIDELREGEDDNESDLDRRV